jgi:arabinan endo-1,5-alpha-L-arabinosidase
MKLAAWHKKRVETRFSINGIMAGSFIARRWNKRSISAAACLNRTAAFTIQLSLVLLLAACRATPPLPEATAVAEPPATSTTEPLPTATPALAPGLFHNPVLDQDFPDPDVLQVDGVYYAYATNSKGIRVQAARSEDLVNWTWLPDALPRLPEWAVHDFGWVWAPEVTTGATAGTYLMYYTARYRMGFGGVQCIGLALADAPDGHFESPLEEPFICQIDEGGSIDAASFVDDDGRRYLLWKNDGNSRGSQTWIYIQELPADGLALLGEPVRLIRADQFWEGPLVEAPTLWKHDDRYVLFYSANDYASLHYAVGYAIAGEIFGPYEKAPRPLLATNIAAGVVGPGGQDVVIGPDGQTWMLFHAWSGHGYRHLNLVRLDWTEEAHPVLVP